MDGDAVSVTDSSEECVFREDTLVLLEMTTRDMMEARQTRWSAVAGPGVIRSVAVHMSCPSHRWGLLSALEKDGDMPAAA